MDTSQQATVNSPETRGVRRRCIDRGGVLPRSGESRRRWFLGHRLARMAQEALLRVGALLEIEEQIRARQGRRRSAAPGGRHNRSLR